MKIKPLSLRDRKGNMIVWGPVLLLALLTFSALLFEHSRLDGIAKNTRDAVQAAMTQVCTDNGKNVYSGVREGYAGGYRLVNADWKPEVTESDILEKVDAKLGTRHGVKTSDGKKVYEISNLRVKIKNPPLAPAGTDGAAQLTGSAAYTLTVPLSFGWSSLPPMVIQMDASSVYSPQGQARGNAGQPGSGQPVTRISLSACDMTLGRGDTEVLSASVSPEDADDSRLSWTSTDSKVCTVTQTGAVTGVDRGTASVVALSTSGQMAACRVTVVNPVTGIVLDKSSMTMIQGAAASLTATVEPDDATERGVQWASSDSKVCTVDSSGKVTAAGAGKAKITVMTREGGYYAECIVTVTVPVSGLTLDKTSLTMKKGDTDKLTATVYPSGAKPDVLWASSDSGVCTVDQTGMITAVGNGSAVISATTKDLKYTATCAVSTKSTPGPVRNLIAVMATKTKVKISWDAPENTGSSPITSYQVIVNKTTYTVKSGTSLTVACPTNSDTLSITVYAVNSAGNGDPADAAYRITKTTRTEPEYDCYYSHHVVIRRNDNQKEKAVYELSETIWYYNSKYPKSGGQEYKYKDKTESGSGKKGNFDTTVDNDFQYSQSRCTSWATDATYYYNLDEAVYDRSVSATPQKYIIYYQHETWSKDGSRDNEEVKEYTSNSPCRGYEKSSSTSYTSRSSSENSYTVTTYLLTRIQ